MEAFGDALRAGIMSNCANLGLGLAHVEEDRSESSDSSQQDAESNSSELDDEVEAFFFSPPCAVRSVSSEQRENWGLKLLIGQTHVARRRFL